MSDDIQYPDHFIERLHKIWGEGFLSPGGVEEVREILTDLDLEGKTVLDIGCGTGGPAIALVTEHRAGKVVSIDIEPLLLEKATKNIERAQVAEKVELKLVKPGPLPFDDESFDVVFSKDSLIHVEDKPTLFVEILRVLKPGGIFAASDWLSGEEESGMPPLERFRELAHLTFVMANAPQMESILQKAGFENVSSRDRNEWFVQIANQDLQRIEGPLYKSLIDDFGEEIVSQWLKVRRAMTDAADAGGLRPTHLRGFKPITT